MEAGLYLPVSHGLLAALNEADYLPATFYQKLTRVDEEGKFYTLYKVCMATVVAILCVQMKTG